MTQTATSTRTGIDLPDPGRQSCWPLRGLGLLRAAVAPAWLTEKHR